MARGDITSVRLLYLKGGLFLLLGLLAGGLLVLDRPTLRTLVLLGITVWAFCRAYYFAFYVVGHYAEPGRSYAGLIDFARTLWKRRGRGTG